MAASRVDPKSIAHEISVHNLNRSHLMNHFKRLLSWQVQFKLQC
jgi:hypothetical protein